MNLDFNGDLIDDIIIQKTSISNNNLEIDETRIDYFNHLGKLANSSTISKPVYNGVVTNVIPQGINFFHTGDFNGDGSTDYIYILTTSLLSSHKYFVSFPSINKFNHYLVSQSGSNLNLESADLIKVLDMDGDGKHELMVVKEGGSKIYSINKSSDPMVYHATEIYNGGFPTKWHKVYITDFNGDGKSDLLTKSDASAWSVYHSNGNNYDFVSSVSFNAEPNVDNLASLSTHGTYIGMADFNGDGKSDIIHVYKYKNQAKFNIELLFNNGISFNKKTYNDQDFSFNHEIITGDFNGDGKADINVKFNVNNSLLERKIIFFESNDNPLLLSRVKDGVGNQDEFSYNTLSVMKKPTVSYIGQFENIYNQFYGGLTHFNGNLYIRMPINVVKTYKNQGNKVDLVYKYSGAMLNKKGRGMLGFREVSVYDKIKNLAVTSYFNKFIYSYDWPDYIENDFISIDTVVDIWTLKNIGTTKKSIFNALHPYVNGYKNKTHWFRNRKTETTSINSGNTTTNFLYDDYGNVVSKEYINADGHIQTVQYNYGANAANRPALPLEKIETYSRNSLPAITYKSTMEYDNLFQLKKKIDFSDKSNKITTEFQYDYRGHTAEQKITGTNMSPRVTQYQYDVNDLFLVKEKNSLGQETNYSIDPKWNKPLAITGINGLTTSFVYDWLGRDKYNTMPGGSQNYTFYEWTTGSDQLNFNNYTSVYKVTSKSFYSNGITWSVWNESAKYYDKCNTLLSERKRNPDGVSCYSKIYYNQRKQAYKSEMYRSTTFINGTLTNYDAWDRPMEKYYIDDNNNSELQSTISYIKLSNGWEITETKPSSTTNPLGRSSKTKISFGGEKLSTSENGINELTYTYNAEGKNLNVIEANSSKVLTSVEYDIYGRQVKLIDNSTGTITFKYNSLGELIEQQNANAGWHKFEYDVLGRKTKEILNEGTITYTYFPAGSGVKTNQLQEIKGYQNLNKEVYDYDWIGRCNKVTKFIAGSPAGTSGYVSEFTYDLLDRIIQKKTPTGNIYDYYYTNYGNLVSDIKKNGQPIYTLIDLNKVGQPKDYYLGSNTQNNRVVREYNKYFNLSSLSGQYIDDVYNWDNINGNLESKTEGRQAFTYSYLYDNFDRLTDENLSSSGIAGQRQIDNHTAPLDNGNLDVVLSAIKPGGSTPFAYHTNKQFAISTVEEADNFSRFQQDISYNSFNKPSKITQNGFELRYSYDHSLDRISSILTGLGRSLKRYYIGSTEYNYDNSGNLLHAIDYISADGAIVAMDVTTTGSSKLWYVQTDYQDNIRSVFDNQGTAHYINYDAWGKYRINDQWSMQNGDISYDRPAGLPDWLYRGYTGQEHLAEFRLINLNARLYDPHTCRLLSPDKYVTANSLQGFNRYSYCHNNPLKYIDKDGNEPISICVAIGIGIGIALASKATMNVIRGDNILAGSWQSWVVTGLVGGISGAAGFGMGGMMAQTVGGFAGGAITGATTGAIAAYSNHQLSFMFGQSDFNFGNLFKEVGTGALVGGVIGGVAQGISASNDGASFWDGKKVFEAKLGGANGHFSYKVKVRALKFRYFEDAPVYLAPLGKGAGFTTPYGIVISKASYLANDMDLVRHEFGHWLQIKIQGPKYFMATTAPESLWSASTSSPARPHKLFYTETWANRLSYRYFSNNGDYLNPAQSFIKWDVGRFPLMSEMETAIWNYTTKY
ncbi:MAG: FG-GAP-like repeat-containing protein [Chitinophagales bacterium]|jgi:RHS repeat-associated protein|nr:FG-GAP-like repeat-containing protein [Sphingobacteriales bacterium]